MAEEEYGSCLVCVRLRCRNFILTELSLMGVGIPSLGNEWYLDLASWVLEFYGIVCMAPLQLGGIKGKKSTPSIGWEVPVRSHRLASRSWMERGRENDFGSSAYGYGML
jgi:hypothetical protein